MAKKKAAETAPVPAAEPAAPKVDGLKILGLLTENYKRVKVVRIIPKGNMITIGGANESGKSSVLDSIEAGLCGTANIPSSPIRRGEKTGRIQIDLGDYKVTRFFTRTENQTLSKLQIEGKHKERFQSPQQLLDGLMGKISFDPLEFMRMKPKDQLETLRGLVKLDVDIDEIDRNQKVDYEARRFAGREVEQLKARLAAMPEYVDVPDELTDVAELTAAIEKSAEHNRNVANRELVISTLDEAGRRLTQRVTDAKTEILGLEQRIEQLRRQIEADEFAAGAEHREAEEARRILPAAIDVAELTSQLTEATKTNQEVEKKKARVSVADQLETKEAEWKAIDDRMTTRANERQEAIVNAQMPIEGLGFGDGEVYFDGLPFDQASNAAQIRVSVALAMASNPKIRVLRIKDGSLLDDKSRALIAKMAEDNDYQVWMEMVDTSGKVGIVMEDGEAHGEEAELGN